LSSTKPSPAILIFISGTSFFGTASIENWVEIPRKIDPESGKGHNDYFVFVLKDANESAKIIREIFCRY